MLLACESAELIYLFAATLFDINSIMLFYESIKQRWNICLQRVRVNVLQLKNSIMQHTSKYVIIFSGIFLAMALLVWLSDTNEWLFLSLNTLGAYLPDWFWANMTMMGDTLMVIALLVILASIKPNVFAQGMLLLIIGGLVVRLSKDYFGIERPAASLSTEDFNLIGHLLKKGSFPSGHSFTALAAMTLFACQIQRTWATVVLLSLGASFALSRVMVGAHWPLDVLVGSALGALVSLFCVYVIENISWLRHRVLLNIYALLMFLAVLALPFYESHYPDTLCFQYLATVLALFFIIWFYWWPKLSGKEKTESQWRDIQQN